MDTSRLKKFAQFARRSLIEQVQTKLKLVLAEDSFARRESPKTIKELENKKQELGEEQLLEQVAYTWFNRFCALRFMDTNQYNRIMVVSPVAGQFQPEILAEAKAGHLDDGIFNEKARDEINGLLSGTIPSLDGQSEAYRLMIVAVCNDYHRLMPYLFERIEDYTELLMPDDLLSGNSILAYTREAMTPENCESVESIGWLYQFYISEKKDRVFEGLKKNKKITPENIPAATQLFTPHWIVRYLVENSLGRLWMLNNPNSKVIEQMDYYIKPVEEEKDYLKISGPEKLKICDPACGSGHMLTYAYDLLYAIYLDAGYDSSEIPEKILTNNLYGIEIDKRAAELAAFALSMKALKGNPLDESNNRRRFFRNPIEPNVCYIQNVSFSDAELDEYFNFVGVDLFTKDLRVTLKEFEEADNFGSLIQPTLKNPADVLAILGSKDVSGQFFLADTHKSVLKVLKQADYLSPKYHVVVANPPYMGGNGMNQRLAAWIKGAYPNTKSDLFSAFIERNFQLAKKFAYVSMITMQSWMYLSSFEKLRLNIIRNKSISSMAHVGARGFDSIGGEVVQTVAFVIENAHSSESHGAFVDVTSGMNEKEKEEIFLLRKNAPIFFLNDNFQSLPSNIISYQLSEQVVDSFRAHEPIKNIAEPKQGLATMDNDRFLKYWFEVSENNSFFNCETREDAKVSGKKWFPVLKGGEFRRWFGNNELVINWLDDGAEICNLSLKRYGSVTKRVVNREWYFKRGLTFSRIGTGLFSVRSMDQGYIFETAGCTIYPNDQDQWFILGYLNSSVAQLFVTAIAPTLTFQIGDIGRVPFKTNEKCSNQVREIVLQLRRISKSDWDSFETSWDFKKNPLLLIRERSGVGQLSVSLNLYLNELEQTTSEFKALEERNNEFFISHYRLEEAVSAKVDINNVSLLNNPKYRYRIHDGDIFNLQKIDIVKDFISYAVGCILGRYSIDKDGLIFGSHGEELSEYLKGITVSSFNPDKDNVIPLVDFEGDWFEDDITERFKQFLKVTFGEEYFTENLRFIEDLLGKDIKKYLTKDFYFEHIKRYKKRPIYWMFSSPKGSFNALIYMHRYNKDTVDIVLNNYLREFRTKLLARRASLEQIEISASASQKDKTQAIKTIAKINKVLDEINDYEHDVLYPLASEKVEIDLDDGVKHNYPLFGKALKKVPGLS